MTLEEIKNETKEVPEMLAWFASVREHGNMSPNFRGKPANGTVSLMGKMNEKAGTKGNVPVMRFVFHHDGDADSYIGNKLCDAFYDDTWDSRQRANVPYIWPDGNFHNHSI